MFVTSTKDQFLLSCFNNTLNKSINERSIDCNSIDETAVAY